MAGSSINESHSTSSVTYDQLNYIAFQKEEKLKRLESELSYLQQLSSRPKYDIDPIASELNKYQAE